MSWLVLLGLAVGCLGLGFALWRLLGRPHDAWGGRVNRSGEPPESYF